MAGNVGGMSKRQPRSGGTSSFLRNVTPVFGVAFLCLAAAGQGCHTFDPSDHPPPIIQPPPPGSLYHGAFPGNASGREDDVTLESLREYEQLTGKPLAWVYFSHDWFRGRAFPVARARMIRDAGSVPFIRLMLRSDSRHWRAESTYTLQHILDGMFDEDLRDWFRSALEFGTPLIVEYGTEVNGDWFPWNGLGNGGGIPDKYGSNREADGPERFRDAYRHIIRLSREEGSRNITWVFHVNSGDAPVGAWNRLEQFYPGSDWIDWLGVSAYGAQKPEDQAWPRFRDLLDPVYARLTAMAPGTPVVVCEFGATQGSPLGSQEAWAREALDDMVGGRWPRVIGFSWWNEGWRNDADPGHNTAMRLQDNPELARVFRETVGDDPRILGRILLTK